MALRLGQTQAATQPAQSLPKSLIQSLAKPHRDPDPELGLGSDPPTLLLFLPLSLLLLHSCSRGSWLITSGLRSRGSASTVNFERRETSRAKLSNHQVPRGLDIHSVAH
ncbi:hypothetical protein N7505_003924 [Penicillium chrysogenum]|uniref:Uncharacterized protein n=1 Tax=Penicillium chrysogenum TaxID=5076 RepID=A0ABQ8WRT8_PENCH|nr:hypothetical protein N7505_003924 [Penicillium chrysogenum]KAJ5285893.1 hypothetical protein N7524_001199 [Penicillium chrysogenum]